MPHIFRSLAEPTKNTLLSSEEKTPKKKNDKNVEKKGKVRRERTKYPAE